MLKKLLRQSVRRLLVCRMVIRELITIDTEVKDLREASLAVVTFSMLTLMKFSSKPLVAVTLMIYLLKLLDRI